MCYHAEQDSVQRRRCLDDRGWYAEDRNVVTQQNSDPAVDSTEFADNAKKREKHQYKLKYAEGEQDGCSNPYQLHSLWWSCRWEVRRGWSQRRRLVPSSRVQHFLRT